MVKKLFIATAAFLLLGGFTAQVVLANREEMKKDLEDAERTLLKLIEILQSASEIVIDIPPEINPQPVPGSDDPGLAEDSTVPSSFRFTQDLKRGDTGDAPRYLQIVLNSDPATTVAATGFGSPGNETRFFGMRTVTAVKKFQQKYASEILAPAGISQPSGVVDKLTRDKLNAILATGSLSNGGGTTVNPPASDPDPEPDPDPDHKDEENDDIVENPCGVRTNLRDGRDQNVYNIVEIGSQCWMAESLKHEATGSWCYNNSLVNCTKYGRLYSFATAKNACPTGWRLPTDSDFKKLEKELGMSQDEIDKSGWRGSVQGTALKSSTAWDGDNSSGFNAIAGGGREDGDLYVGLETAVLFWTATESGSLAWARQLRTGYPTVSRIIYSQRNGLYVRCIMDN